MTLETTLLIAYATAGITAVVTFVVGVVAVTTFGWLRGGK